MKYKVTRNCKITYMTPDGEELILLDEGQIVQLPEDKAAWINRDSPGALEAIEGGERQIEAAPKDRQMRQARTRQKPITKAD